MPQREPVAFLSYAHADDSRGDISRLREQLAEAVSSATGTTFHIFQDRNDINWGQQWQERLHDALDQVTFLIPILTPRFFQSTHCRDEVRRFLERERRLQRNDLILPIYFREHPPLSSAQARDADEILAVIATHQYADWRELRYEPVTSALVLRALDRMADQIRDALERVGAGHVREATAPTRASATPATEPQPTATPIPSTERGPSPKTEIPTLIVDPFHRGDHTTIAAAIAAAQPGDRIVVRPGLYREGLVIEKPLEIVGEGPRADIVIEAAGQDVILFTTSMGRVANLTLRQMGGGYWHGVDIAQGRLELEDCDISSESLACVAVHGGADPRIRRCRIHDGKSVGVGVYEQGRGTLEDNEIVGNAQAGVAITTGGDPTLRHNTIRDGESSGVYVFGQGRGTLEDNQIVGNTQAGVAIKTGGDPTLRRNTIHDGKSVGVGVYEQGRGTLEDNEIIGNARAGVEIRTGGDPTLRRNTIRDGKNVGVSVYEEGRGTLEDNQIIGNARVGVEIRTGGNPMMRRNTIRDGKQSGVFVYEQGRGTLEDNQIVGNAHAGVEITTGGDPTLRRNTIRDGKSAGVFVYEQGRGTLEDNDLRGNAGGAWDISEDSADKVQRARNQE